jgi:hypothetical protein
VSRSIAGTVCGRGLSAVPSYIPLQGLNFRPVLESILRLSGGLSLPNFNTRMLPSLFRGPFPIFYNTARRPQYSCSASHIVWLTQTMSLGFCRMTSSAECHADPTQKPRGNHTLYTRRPLSAMSYNLYFYSHTRRKRIMQIQIATHTKIPDRFPPLFSLSGYK